MRRMFFFASRNRKEMLRDPLSLIFGVGFPVVLLILLHIIQSNIPQEANMNLFDLTNLTPGIGVFGLSFIALFAAMLIFHGILDLQGAIALAGMGWPRWWINLLLAVMTLALGALIFCNPMGSFFALIMVIGGALIFDGVSDLCIISTLGREIKRSAREEESAVDGESGGENHE